MARHPPHREIEDLGRWVDLTSQLPKESLKGTTSGSPPVEGGEAAPGREVGGLGLDRHLTGYT